MRTQPVHSETLLELARRKRYSRVRASDFLSSAEPRCLSVIAGNVEKHRGVEDPADCLSHTNRFLTAQELPSLTLSSAAGRSRGWPTFAFPDCRRRTKPAAPPFAVFERWESMLQARRGFGRALEEHGSVVLPGEVKCGTAGCIVPILRTPRLLRNY